MSVTVRAAEPGDVDWIVAALAEFDASFPAARPLYDDYERVLTQVRQAISVGPFWVAETADSYPVGFLYGAVIPHPLNPAIRVLSEVLWWVYPDARRTRAGSLLLDAYVAYGREHADWIVVTERCEDQGRAAFTRRGFRPLERNYLYEVH